MTNEASVAVARMAAAGEWPEPQLMEDIIAHGAAAVPPLLEIVGREAHGWPEEAPLYHALGLLSMLPAPEALPVLLQLFYRYDNENLEALPAALVHYGTAVVEPLLAIIQNPNLHWYSQSVASGIAVTASRNQPELHQRVRATLRRLLADYVARADSLTANEVSSSSSLVITLAYLADQPARELINAALAAELSEMMGENDVEACYKLGERFDTSPKNDWLTDYRHSFEEHLAREQRRNEPKPMPIPPPTPTPVVPPLPKPIAPVRKERKIGRNDPCWCGSKKKYKHCHMRQESR